MKSPLTTLTLATTVVLSSLSADEFKLDWTEFHQFENEPEWFKDSKIGIYFHWGPYSVPEHSSEWYPRWMHFEGHPVYKHHVEKYGHPSEFGYHDFVPMFKAEHFDAGEWAELFKKAGARFAGPVAEHHDGFAMWDSEITPWNVADKGPKRDITGELEKAIRAEGMKFIATFHHARNLQRPNDPENYEYEFGHRRHYNHTHMPAFEGMPPASEDDELKYLYGNMPEDQWLEEVWLGKLKEVIDNYDPDIIWFDAWLDKIPEDYRREYLKYYYEEGKKKGQQVVTTYKQRDFPDDVAVFNIEKGGKKTISPEVWQSDDTVSFGSWSFTDTLKIKPVSMVVHGLIDIVSKNGVLLLNISPKADGTIPEDQKNVLLEMGEWLEMNGEAIYATRPWYVYGEGPTQYQKGTHGGIKTTTIYTSKDIRYTQSKDGSYVYAFVLKQPGKDEVITLESFKRGKAGEALAIDSIQLIGSTEKVEWKRDMQGIHIEAPNTFESEIALVYRLRTN
ncbi:alpha-L-fucosidase [Pelagicoccus mobilis]|uniref:alpha-L-fucosidase n=1 Tax=Pelagicoccus mobilis TaxID=415221 RepID=A0A934RYN3_9BACT|nr:alpha-L-fucosidase [Pelagicoccus mobilis]MBK1875943.1 alpha-L-fucosidase [Pelagicoccus mobilis]